MIEGLTLNRENLGCEDLILKRLSEAGPTGLTPTQFKLPSLSSQRGKVCRQLLGQLLKQGKIGNLGTRHRPIFVIAQYYLPLELAYEQIEMIAKESGTRLRSRSFFVNSLKGAVKLKADEALKLLIQEGQLVKLMWAGRPVYVHISSLPQSLSSSINGIIPSNAEILQAYRETVDEFGYADVMIQEVFLRLGGELDSFKEALKEACQKGRAIASVGDWSLSSKEEKKAAIYINGTAHLRIRFTE